MKRVCVGLFVLIMLVSGATVSSPANGRRSPRNPLPNIFMINPSVCLALTTNTSCVPAVYDTTFCEDLNRQSWFTLLDKDEDGELTRKEANRFSFSGNQLHKKDGSVIVVIFVEGVHDHPVMVRTNRGKLRITGFTDEKSFVCSLAPTILNDIRADEDCDNDKVRGDGIIFAQLLGADDVVGPGELTVFDTTDGEVVGDLKFQIVGETRKLRAGAFETTLAGDLPDVNGDRVVDKTDCPLPGDSAGFLDAINDPNKTVIFARTSDTDDTDPIGSWWHWEVDDDSKGVVAAADTPTLDLGSFGFGAPQVFCRTSGPSQVTLTMETRAGPLTLSSFDAFRNNGPHQARVYRPGQAGFDGALRHAGEVACDGTASADVSAFLITSEGKPDESGAQVHWLAQALGINDPINSKTVNGTATTKVTPSPA